MHKSKLSCVKVGNTNRLPKRSPHVERQLLSKACNFERATPASVVDNQFSFSIVPLLLLDVDLHLTAILIDFCMC